MESYSSNGLDDFWKEYRTLRHRSASAHSEDEGRSHDDDNESDDTYLEDLGLPVKDGTDLSDDHKRIYDKFVNTLTPRQEEALKRIQTFKSSYRKKRQKGKSQKPDIRNIFSSTDASSTGTRSRSGTPDSLDSVSPPHTPPDPHPKTWADPYLSQSRGSLDSGNHSLVTSSSVPPQPSSLVPPSQSSPNSYDSEDDHKRHRSSIETDGRFTYQPDPQWSRPNRSPSFENLAQIKPFSSKDVSIRRQRSYARDLARDMKQYYSNKGIYDINSASRYNNPNDDIKVLRYEHIGSLHIPHSRFKDKRPTLESARLGRNSPNNEFGTQDNRQWSLNKEVEHENSENRIRSASSTDLGFKVINRPGEEFPELKLELSRSGTTRIDWLDPRDTEKLNSLAMLELDIIYNIYSVHHRWRKHKKKKNKHGENSVFGVPIENLVEKDRMTFPEPYCENDTPLLVTKLISHLERHGIKEEGILRVPGNRSKTESLKQTLNQSFYTSSSECDSALRSASANELAAVIKHFLRELPQPILTHTYMSAFYKTIKITDLGERVMALTMLIILLPKSHRDTLRTILELCAQIVYYEFENRMGLYNVSMIMAPNLFLPTLYNNRPKLPLKSEDKEQQLNHEMEYATVTTHLTQLLIKYRDILWTVPHRLLAQIRRQHDLDAHRLQSNKHIYRLLNRKMKDIQRPIANEIDYQEGVLRVSATQFNKENFPVKLDSHMTAGDVISRFIEEQTETLETPVRVEGRREQSKKFSSPHMITTCLMRGSFKHALDNHALHEKGGNIGDRRLDHRAKLLTVYQDNPNAEYVVMCHHPGGHIVT